MKSESELTRQWCAKLEACRASVLPVVAGMRGKSGWPDRFIAYGGVGIWIEFKGPNGKLSALQRLVIARLIDNGQYVYVGRFVPGFDENGENGDDGNVYLVLEAPKTGKGLAVCKTTKDLLQFMSRLTPANVRRE